MPLILPKQGEFKMEEKKSRFLGACKRVIAKEDALAFIEETRGRHKGANHNVSAYSLREGNIVRFNDDGEPGGTAGMPVLNVYQKAGIVDFVCVVTRYFGGTLLGAGGLVRAYTRAAKGAMDDAGPEELIIRKLYRLTCTYPQLDKLKYNLDKLGIEVFDWQYTDTASATARVREDQDKDFFTCKDEHNLIICPMAEEQK